MFCVQFSYHISNHRESFFCLEVKYFPIFTSGNQSATFLEMLRIATQWQDFLVIKSNFCSHSITQRHYFFFCPKLHTFTLSGQHLAHHQCKAKYISTVTALSVIFIIHSTPVFKLTLRYQRILKILLYTQLTCFFLKRIYSLSFSSISLPLPIILMIFVLFIGLAQ